MTEIIAVKSAASYEESSTMSGKDSIKLAVLIVVDSLFWLYHFITNHFTYSLLCCSNMVLYIRLVSRSEPTDCC